MTPFDAKTLISSHLKTVMENLPEAERCRVEFPLSIENYKLSHPTGSFLIVYRGGKFSRSESVHTLQQERDIVIAVIAVIRGKDKSKSVEEHVEFLIDQVSGLEVENAREEKLIYCVEDNFIKEEAGIWWHEVNFAVPVDYVEKSLQE